MAETPTLLHRRHEIHIGEAGAGTMNMTNGLINGHWQLRPGDPGSGTVVQSGRHHQQLR